MCLGGPTPRLKVATYAVILSVTDFAYIPQFAECAILTGFIFDQTVYAVDINSANHCYQRILVLQDCRDSKETSKQLIMQFTDNWLL